MLLPADAELARREAAIPGLPLLLDPEAFVAALRTSLPGADVQTAQVTYVRYKPGTSCLVAYRLQVAGAETDVYARAYRAGNRGKFEKARPWFKTSGLLGPGGVILDDAVIAVFAFPNDRGLDMLAPLADEEARRRLFTRLLPDRPDLWGATLHSLRYKPEQRYVAQMVTEGGECAVLKTYAGADYLAASRGAKVFRSRAPLRIAQRLGRSNLYRSLVLEWLPGRSLSEAVRDPRFEPEAVRAVGAALAALHAQMLPRRLRSPTHEKETANLLAAAGAVAAVCPHLAERGPDLARRMAARLQEIPCDARAIHGDFAADQVLLMDEGVAILDLDAVAWGDPAVDLGTFAARLEWDVLRGDLSADRAEALTQAVLEGYCAAAHRDLPAHFDLYVTAGLLRVAPHAFRSREPDWPELTQAILERAEESERRPSSGGRRKWFRMAESILDALAILELPTSDLERLGLPSGALELRRARPRSSHRLGLEYAASDGQTVAGQWLGDVRRFERVAQATAHASTAPTTLVVDVEGTRVLLQAKGADRRLPGLAPLLAQPGAVLLVHRPERRAVVRLEPLAGRAVGGLDRTDGLRYAKVVRPERTQALVAAARTARDLARGAFAVPDLLEVDVGLGVTVWSALPGVSFNELLQSSWGLDRAWARREASSALRRPALSSEQLIPAARAAGCALRALHAAPPPADIRVHSGSDEIEMLQRWLQRLEPFVPRLGGPFRTVAAGVFEGLDASPAPHVLLHRDFYDKQILVDKNGRIGLLDFDTLAVGEAALDVANALVHLELRVLQKRCPPEEAAAVGLALLEGYQPAAQVCRRIGAYADATRLRLACIYGFRPRKAPVAFALLTRVGQPVVGEIELD
jgi:aminoglycoside phosphotransferase (APT) family kinase protein